jgi:hypothetical protein
LDRSRKANNPEAFNKNGTIKPEVRLKKTKEYRRAQKKLAELRRKRKGKGKPRADSWLTKFYPWEK